MCTGDTVKKIHDEDLAKNMLLSLMHGRLPSFPSDTTTTTRFLTDLVMTDVDLNSKEDEKPQREQKQIPRVHEFAWSNQTQTSIMIQALRFMNVLTFTYQQTRCIDTCPKQFAMLKRRYEQSGCVRVVLLFDKKYQQD